MAMGDAEAESVPLPERINFGTTVSAQVHSSETPYASGVGACGARLRRHTAGRRSIQHGLRLRGRAAGRDTVVTGDCTTGTDNSTGIQ